MVMTEKSLWKKFSIFILVICILTSGFTGIAGAYLGMTGITVEHYYSDDPLVSEYVEFSQSIYGTPLLDFVDTKDDHYTVTGMELERSTYNVIVNAVFIYPVLTNDGVAYYTDVVGYTTADENLEKTVVSPGGSFNANLSDYSDIISLFNNEYSYVLLSDNDVLVDNITGNTVINFYYFVYHNEIYELYPLGKDDLISKLNGFWDGPVVNDYETEPPIDPDEICADGEYVFGSSDYNYTLKIFYEPPSDREYTVTYRKNIGSAHHENWISYTDPATHLKGARVEALTIAYLANNSDSGWNTGTFTGWTSSEDKYLIYYGPDYNFTMPAKDVVLTAHWESEWAEVPSLMFNATGGTFDDSVVVESSTLTDELEQILDDDFDGNSNGLLQVENITPLSTITAPSPAPTREGYIFSHWLYEAMSQDGMETVYIPWKFTGDPDAYGVPYGQTYLEAQWTPVGEPAAHTVTFNAMGGEFDENNVSISSSVLTDTLAGSFGVDGTNELFIVSGVSDGAEISEPDEPPVLDHHQLDGWYYLNDDSDKVFWNFTGSSVPDLVEDSIVLYAEWTEDDKYTVTYHASDATGGTVPVDSLSPYYSGSKVIVLDEGDLERDNYVFAGWNKTSAAGTTVDYYADDDFFITTNMNLYAVWTEQHGPVEYTITYAPGAAGASAAFMPDPLTYDLEEGDIFNIVNTEPEWIGYDFEGWKRNDTGVVHNAGDNFEMPGQDVTLTAQWSTGGSLLYAVTYEPGDAGASATSMPAPLIYYLEKNDVFTLDSLEPEWIEHSFEGWLRNDTNSEYDAGNNFTMPANDVILTAQWGYTVVYHANGAAGNVPVDGNSYRSGDTVTVKQKGNLQMQGYSFKGWNTMIDGSGTTYQPAATFDIYENADLYAQWKKDNDNGGGGGGGSSNSGGSSDKPSEGFEEEVEGEIPEQKSALVIPLFIMLLVILGGIVVLRWYKRRLELKRMRPPA